MVVADQGFGMEVLEHGFGDEGEAHFLGVHAFDAFFACEGLEVHLARAEFFFWFFVFRFRGRDICISIRC